VQIWFAYIYINSSWWNFNQKLINAHWHLFLGGCIMQIDVGPSIPVDSRFGLKKCCNFKYHCWVD